MGHLYIIFNIPIQFIVLHTTPYTSWSFFIQTNQTVISSTLHRTYFKVIFVYWCLFNGKLQIFNFSNNIKQTYLTEGSVSGRTKSAGIDSSWHQNGYLFAMLQEPKVSPSIFFCKFNLTCINHRHVVGWTKPKIANSQVWYSRIAKYVSKQVVNLWST